MAPVRDQHALGCDVDPSSDTQVLGDHLSELDQPRRWAVVGLARTKRLVGRIADVGRRVEVGLADLEMDDVATLPLELSRPGKHREGALGSQAVEACRQSELDPRRHGASIHRLPREAQEALSPSERGRLSFDRERLTACRLDAECCAAAASG